MDEGRVAAKSSVHSPCSRYRRLSREKKTAQRFALCWRKAESIGPNRQPGLAALLFRALGEFLFLRCFCRSFFGLFFRVL